MTIPKSFQLGGSTINVEVVSNPMETGSAAWIELATGRIKVSSNYVGSPCSQDYIESGFYHELVHGILQTMGKKELDKDEEFVEGFANLLHQFIKSAKYE
jgi:hypothetical protein